MPILRDFSVFWPKFGCCGNVPSNLVITLLCHCVCKIKTNDTAENTSSNGSASRRYFFVHILCYCVPSRTHGCVFSSTRFSVSVHYHCGVHWSDLNVIQREMSFHDMEWYVVLLFRATVLCILPCSLHLAFPYTSLTATSATNSIEQTSARQCSGYACSVCH